MIELNLANSVFVDNTANDEIKDYYPEILDASISISTPNKVAVSSSYEDYVNLKNLADLRNVKFFYETNVGAGLPLLTTLTDLIHSGDRIIKIEGVSQWFPLLHLQHLQKGPAFQRSRKRSREKRLYRARSPR